MAGKNITTYRIKHEDEAGGRYPAGSTVYVDADRPVGHGSIVLARVNGLLMIRRYSQLSGTHRLEPFDTQSMTLEIPDLTCLLGVVISCSEEE